MCVAHVNVAGGDDIGIVGNTAHLSANRKSNAREKIEHTSANVLIRKLQIENHRAVVEKVLGDADNVLIFFGANNL